MDAIIRSGTPCTVRGIIGHPAYNVDDLGAGLHRFAFLLGETGGEELFGEPTPRPPGSARRAHLTGSPV